MDDFMRNYIQQVAKEFGEAEKSIVIKKKEFQLTKWTDEKSMIEAANEIWDLEKRLKSANEVNKIILDNYRTGE